MALPHERALADALGPDSDAEDVGTPAPAAATLGHLRAPFPSQTAPPAARVSPKTQATRVAHPEAQATRAGDTGGVSERRESPRVASPGKQPPVQTEPPRPARKQAASQLEKLLTETSTLGLGAAEGPRQRHRVVRLSEEAPPSAQRPPEEAPFKSAMEELSGGTKRRSGNQPQAVKKPRTGQRGEEAAQEGGPAPAAVSTPTQFGGLVEASDMPPTRKQPVRQKSSPKALDDTVSDDVSQATPTKAARPPKAKKAPGVRGVEKLLAVVAKASRGAAAAGADAAASAVVTLHAYGSARLPTDAAVQRGTQPTLWCDAGTCSPGPLLRGSDPAFWGALRSQGAVVVKIRGPWDAANNTSAVADLRWLLHSTSTMGSMREEYQLIRQALPRLQDGLVERQREEWGLKGYPFGALLNDVAHTFTQSGQPFTTMSVPDREATFLDLARSGRPMLFPYLQGLTLAAHGSSTRPHSNGLLRAIPAGGAHHWETSGLPVVPGSCLPDLLKTCEALCNPALRQDTALDTALEALRHDTAAQPPDGGPGQEAAGAAATTCSEAAPTAGSAGDSVRPGFAVPPSAEAREWQERTMQHRATHGPLPSSLAAAVRDAGKAPARRAAAADGAAASVDADLAAGLARSEAQMDEFLWGAGIVSPWLYFSGVFSTFGAHIEDYAFGSANAIVSAPGSEAFVVWYSVPREQLGLMHEFMQHLRGRDYSLNCLEERNLWIDPSRVTAWNEGREAQGKPLLTVFRHVQGPGEYVVTDYGSVHWGVNLGVGWKSAVNFGCEEWLAAAQQVDGVYTALEAKTGQHRHNRTCPRLSTDPQAQAAFQPDKLRAWAAAGPNPGGSDALGTLEAREEAGRAAYGAAWARLNAAAAQ